MDENEEKNDINLTNIQEDKELNNENYQINDKVQNKKISKKKKILIILLVIFLIIVVFPGILFAIVVFNSANNTLEKPIIYLYPEKEEEIEVSLGKPYCLMHTYPKYEKQGDWRVLASPDGKLIDLKTKRKLYSLYYENKSDVDFKIENEGFVVKGEDTIKFLEEKLAILGLNEYEAQEMIIYWLPQLENNKYNYIRFASKEEIEENMPLEFSKEPDSLIRILMLYKPLNKKIEVKEQKLITPERKGFTVVEC